MELVSDNAATYQEIEAAAGSGAAAPYRETETAAAEPCQETKNLQARASSSLSEEHQLHSTAAGAFCQEIKEAAGSSCCTLSGDRSSCTQQQFMHIAWHPPRRTLIT